MPTPTRSAIPAASHTQWETKAKSRVWCSTPRLRSAFALLALVLAVLATFVRPPATPGPFARDFEAYYAGGATWNRGGNPWSRDVWRIERTIPGVDAARDEVLPFVGPAAALPLWSLLARLPFDAARNVWLAVLVLAAAILVGATLPLAAGTIATLDVLGAALVAATSGPFISAIALGQAALVSAAAIAVALLAFERRWSIVAGAATCLAALQPNLVLVLGVRRVNVRTVAILFGAAIAFLGITLLCGGGLRGLAAYRDLLAEHGAGERFTLIQYSIPAVLAAFGVAHDAALAAGRLVLIAVAGAAIAMMTLRDRSIIVAATAIALLPLALPFFHEHDFVVELVPLLVLGRAAGRRTRVLASIAAVCILGDWFGIAQRPHTALPTACTAAAVTCAWIAYANHAQRPLPLAVPLATYALVAAGAIPLALAHPAPVWPDLLGPFHAPPAAAIGAVWAMEQARAGLDATNSAWGILRAIPLAGCLALALAGALALREGRDRSATTA